MATKAHIPYFVEESLVLALYNSGISIKSIIFRVASRYGARPKDVEKQVYEILMKYNKKATK